MSTAHKPRLNEDQREVLEALARAPEGLEGVSIQRQCRAWPIRPAIDSLTRRNLIAHDGYREVAYRQYTISDAGREALR